MRFNVYFLYCFEELLLKWTSGVVKVFKIFGCKNANNQTVPREGICKGKKSNIWIHMMSGFCYDVNEICALLGFYAAYSGKSVLTFRDNQLVPSSRDGLFQNGSTELPFCIALNPNSADNIRIWLHITYIRQNSQQEQKGMVSSQRGQQKVLNI
jgi:hypothetical protein